MIRSFRASLITACLSLSALIGCGGGSGSTSTQTQPPVPPPDLPFNLLYISYDQGAAKLLHAHAASQADVSNGDITNSLLLVSGSTAIFQGTIPGTNVFPDDYYAVNLTTGRTTDLYAPTGIQQSSFQGLSGSWALFTGYLGTDHGLFSSSLDGTQRITLDVSPLANFSSTLVGGIGTQVLFKTVGPAGETLTISEPDGSLRKVLATAPSGDTINGWILPPGTSAAIGYTVFSDNPDTSANSFLMNANGTDLTPLFPGSPCHILSVAGQGLLVERDLTTATELDWVPADLSAPVVLDSNPGTNAHYSFGLQNGVYSAGLVLNGRIFFTVTGAAPGNAVKSVNFDGTGLTPVFASSSPFSNPIGLLGAAGGRVIARISLDDSHDQILSALPDGSGQLLLASNQAADDVLGAGMLGGYVLVNHTALASGSPQTIELDCVSPDNSIHGVLGTCPNAAGTLDVGGITPDGFFAVNDLANQDFYLIRPDGSAKSTVALSKAYFAATF